MAYVSMQLCGVFEIFMKKPAGAAFSSRTCLKSSHRSCQEGNLTSYCQVINYLLSTYATGDIIAEASAEFFIYKRPEDFNVVNYSQSHCTQTLRCAPVYEVYWLNGPSIEGLR